MIKWRKPTVLLSISSFKEPYESVSVVKRLSRLLDLGFTESEAESFQFVTCLVVVT